jgi:hypothetical protein
MNAFLARSAMAIRNWCDRNFQSGKTGTGGVHAASSKVNWSSFFSDARCLTTPAPTMTIRLANIATGTGMEKSKPKLWTVRIVRIRRRRRKQAAEHD